MNVKALFEDDDAVSPVIGVILMVAITVILAAVIGTFVLGLQDRVGDAAPNAAFSWDFNDGGDGWGTAGNDYVNITHDGGEKLDPGTISVSIAGTSPTISSGPWTNDITAGDTVSISDGGTLNGADVAYSNEFAQGDEVRVIWSSSSSDSTQTISQNEVN